MTYVRKTKDVYEVQGDYGTGWECVTEEESWKEAKEMLRCYIMNEHQYPHRIKNKRVKIEEAI